MDHFAVPSTEENSGFTLIEVLISLVLFALISLAGISLVQTVIDVQNRTEMRGTRLVEIQRALYLLGADMEQMSSVPRVDAEEVLITRAGEAGDFQVTYTFSDGALRRASGDHSTLVLDGIAGFSIRFLIDNKWAAIPQKPTDLGVPRAIEISMRLAPGADEPSGPIRRVIELPALAR